MTWLVKIADFGADSDALCKLGGGKGPTTPSTRSNGAGPMIPLATLLCEAPLRHVPQTVELELAGVCHRRQVDEVVAILFLA